MRRSPWRFPPRGWASARRRLSSIRAQAPIAVRSCPSSTAPAKVTRRTWIRTSAATAVAAALGGPTLLFPRDETRGPHFPPRARRLLVIHLPGGVSHVDTFDPKPRLARDDGRSAGPEGRVWRRSPWSAAPRGHSGLLLSDLLPELGRQADRLVVIRSMHTDHDNHAEATLAIHTGATTPGRPSIGSWVAHALGPENSGLPAFVVLAPDRPYAGDRAWAAGALGAEHAGILVTDPAAPFTDLGRRQPCAELQELEAERIRRLDRRHLETRRDDAHLAGRLRALDLALALQRQAPAAFSIDEEAEETRGFYGLDREPTARFGRQCLVARRLLERGVRVVELIDTGSHGNWDAHQDMRVCERLARAIDRPLAALLCDLERRGLLDDTLVVGTTEFGRTPWASAPGSRGRDHHARAFSCWLAGAGTRGGRIVGRTDEHGVEIVEDPVHVRDLHATIFWALGLDAARLVVTRSGRPLRPSERPGRVVRAAWA